MYKYTVKVYCNGVLYRDNETVYGYNDYDIYEELNDVYKSLYTYVKYEIIKKEWIK